MKRLVFAVLFLTAVMAHAQAATRTAVITWTASTSTSVTSYSIFRCTVVSPATSCTPSTTGTPLGTATGVTYTDNPTIGSAYGYSIVAVAPPCSSTTSLTTACGNAPAAGPGYIPVPLLVDGAHSIVVVIP